MTSCSVRFDDPGRDPQETNWQVGEMKINTQVDIHMLDINSPRGRYSQEAGVREAQSQTGMILPVDNICTDGAAAYVNAPPLAIVAKRVRKRISLFPYHPPDCIQYVLYKLALPESYHLDREYARKVDELRAGAEEQAESRHVHA